MPLTFTLCSHLYLLKKKCSLLLSRFEDVTQRSPKGKGIALLVEHCVTFRKRLRRRQKKAMTKYGIVVKVLAKTLFLSHTRLFNMLHGLIDRRQFINNPPGGGGDTYRRLPYKIDRDFIKNF